MEQILLSQIGKFLSLSHQIPLMSYPEGRPEALSVILSRLIKLVSKEELSSVSRFLSAFNDLLSGYMSEENLLAKQDKRIRKAQEFIKKNYDKPVKLSDVAKYAGLSAGALSRLFREKTGKTIMDYLINVRIEHSAIRLRETDDLISEIAFSCGFNSVSYFCATFREKMKMSPGKWRKP